MPQPTDRVAGGRAQRCPSPQQLGLQDVQLLATCSPEQLGHRSLCHQPPSCHLRKNNWGIAALCHQPPSCHLRKNSWGIAALCHQPPSRSDRNDPSRWTLPRKRGGYPFLFETQRYARKTHRTGKAARIGISCGRRGGGVARKQRSPALSADVRRQVRRSTRPTVNLLMIDPFPPGAHDAGGIHQVISAVYSDEPFRPGA